MKDKNLMLFGLSPEQSSPKGVWMFLAIYLGATLFASVLTPPVYWIAQFINDTWHTEDTQWLVGKGVDDFYDRIRWIPIVAALPWMMKACGLFSLKYAGLALTGGAARKFLAYFAFGIALAAAIFSLQIRYSYDPHEARLRLPEGEYSLSADLGGGIPKAETRFQVGPSEERSKSLNREFGDARVSVTVYSDPDDFGKRLVVCKLSGDAGGAFASLQNSKGESFTLDNISKKDPSGFGTGSILSAFFGGLAGAMIIALLEETVFRVLIFRSIYTAWGLSWGIILTSAFFAYKHFKVPGSVFDNIPGGLCHAEWYTGFLVAWYDSVGVFINFNAATFSALTAFGAVLAVFYAKTRTLWSAIGFHAGIVAAIFTYKDNFYVYPSEEQARIFGGAGLSDGWLGCACLCAILAAALVRYRLALSKRG